MQADDSDCPECRDGIVLDSLVEPSEYGLVELLSGSRSGLDRRLRLILPRVIVIVLRLISLFVWLVVRIIRVVGLRGQRGSQTISVRSDGSEGSYGSGPCFEYRISRPKSSSLSANCESRLCWLLW